jgi:hypothetical protein
MRHTTRLLRNFVAFKRIPGRIVASTAVASLILSLGMMTLGQPLYMIVLFALLPWVPVLLFESLWKIEHYSWIAIFAVIIVLQLGHVGEHLVQVGVLRFTDSTLVCPPPVDNAANAQRAIDAGLRSPDIAPTGASATWVIKPNPSGQALMDSRGMPVTAPSACGVFGQLDLEIVHLVWELAGWLLLLALMSQFPRNGWLWVSLVWASIHTVEHLFISYTFFLDPAQTYEGTRQIWGTLASGNIVTAYPLTKEPVMLTFYDVAGRFGIAAKNGLIGSFFPALNPYLPERPYLHLYYNLIVTAPMVIAFVQELRHSYDRYLAKALPQAEQEELAEATPALVTRYFKPGELIVRQGECADSFYVVVRGRVEVLRRDENGQEQVIDVMRSGQFFGEMGLLGDGHRQATVRAATAVEVMQMDRQTFDELMAKSEASRYSVQQTMQERAENLAADYAISMR